MRTGLLLTALTIFTHELCSAPLAPLQPRGDLDAWHVGSITAGRGPAAGYWNPALWGYYCNTSEMEFIFSGEGDDHPQHEEQGFFLNLEGLGFGVLHREDPLGTGSMNTYRLGLGFGEHGNYTGLAYGWSNGTWDAAQQPDQLVLSSLNQMHRYASLGGSFTLGLGKTFHQPRILYEAGLGLRPFWDRATISLDGAWRFDRDAFVDRSDQYWLGVEVEPLDHVRFSARQAVNIGGNPGFAPDLSVQAGLYLNGLGLSTILPQPDDDALEPGTRYSILISDRVFNKGLPARHRKQLFARVELAGMANEYPWLMAGQKFQLMDFFDDIKAAEENPRVKGLLLDIRPDFNADLAMLREIRQRVAEFKERTGGEVAVYSHEYSLGTLYLASVADRRAMLPVGAGEISNLGRERIYLADVLEEAGLDFVRYNIGAYKGAGEDLDRNAMSDPVRENVGRCLNDLYAHLTSTVQQGYGLSDEEMARVTDKWLFTKDDLRRFGLIDTLIYDDQVEDWVCRRAPDEDEDEGKGDGGIRISLGFKMDKLGKLKEDKVVSLSSLREKKAKRRWSRRPEVAVIYAAGPIMPGRSLGPLLIGDETLMKQFKAAREDDNVKAVVFHIDSPGGSGYASDLVWREMERLKKKKPLIVVQGFVAASGGYYLSMAADTILSSPTTITGSIGVAAGLFVDKGLMANTRLRQDGVWAGKPESVGGAMVMAPLSVKAGSAQFQLPTLPVLGRPLTETQGAELQGLIRDFYNDFVKKVADDRGKSWEDVHAIAEGRVWSGPEAQRLGLVDGQGGLRDGIDLAIQRAGLDKDDVKLREVYPDFSLADFFQLLQLLRQGGGMSAAKQRLMAEQVGLARDLRYSILGSGEPEMLLDDELFRSQGW